MKPTSTESSTTGMSSDWSPLRLPASNSRSDPAITIVSSPPMITIPSVTSGPAAATRNSAPGESVSRFIFITPPNRNRSIPATSIPSRRAANAWPSSCSRIEPKNRADAASATPNATWSVAPSVSRNEPWNR